MNDRVLIIILTLLTLCSCNNIGTKNQAPLTKVITVDTSAQKLTATFINQYDFAIDLNSDNVLDTISLSSSLPDKLSFNRISITLTGISKKTFTAKNEWTIIEKDFLKTNSNFVKTDKFFLQKGKSHSEIFLFGLIDGAGYRQDFSIIYIKDNNVTMVFDKSENDIDVEIPITIADLNKDGTTEFVFRNMFEFYKQVDSLNADIGNYSPYLVYTIDNNFKLNEPLTKKYNEDNFVFAGYKYSEEIKILFPRDKNKKPRIWK